MNQFLNMMIEKPVFPLLNQLDSYGFSYGFHDCITRRGQREQIETVLNPCGQAKRMTRETRNNWRRSPELIG